MNISIDSAKVKVSLVYQGNTFTVTRACYELEGGKKIVAEGLARRSCKDAPNDELGVFISKGRALRALDKKYKKEVIHHPLMG